MDEFLINMNSLRIVMLTSLYFLFCNNWVYKTNATDSNISLKNWPLFVSSFCGRLCQNGSLIITRDVCSHPICFPCDCDEICHIKGTCCPSLNISNASVSYSMVHSDPTSYLDQIYNRVECKLTSFETKPQLYLTVTKCPELWTRNEIKQDCEHPDGNSLESLTPFSDLNSGLVFANIFCVICHGLDPYTYIEDNGNYSNKSSILKPWSYTISCKTYHGLLHLSDQFDLLQAASELHDCKIEFNPQGNITKCPNLFNFSIDRHLTSCPHDAKNGLKELCSNLPNIPALMVSHAKNLFCYKCNEIETPKLSCKGVGNLGGLYLPPLVILFGGSTRNHEQQNSLQLPRCSTNQSMLIEEQCVIPVCPAGKLFRNEDECETVVDNLRGLRYQLHIILYPQTVISPDLIQQAITGLHERFQELSPEKNYDFDVMVCYLGKGHTQGFYFYIQGVIIAPLALSRNDFEKILIKLFITKPFILRDTDKHAMALSIPLRVVCLGREVCQLYQQTLHGHFSITRHCQIILNYIGHYIYHKTKYSTDPDVTKSLICPSVEFNLTEQPVIVDRDMVLTVILQNQSIRVPWSSDIYVVEGNVLVCLRYLRDLLARLNAVSYSDDEIIVRVHYYVDIICLFISCLCLLATILTYLLFPSLRSVPGLNNVCLCLSLLVAQTSLLITSTIGARGVLTEIHCLIHGVILHYSWITSFLWMNTCCIHMYRVFRFQNIEIQRRTFNIYCLYSFGFPIVVIVLNITISNITTDGESMGYDSSICFLDTTTSNLILILGLLTPLVISVLANVVLFLLTIGEIIRVTRMQIITRSSHGVITYVKLSTVTGAFCFISAAAIQFKSPILSLIASPFGALQGLFIFMSFMFNKRVLRLYQGLVSHNNGNTSWLGNSVNASNINNNTQDVVVSSRNEEH